MNEQPVRRRLTTILAADVVGYSRMVAITEEVTLKVLDERIEVMRSLLPRHNGRLFKTMGDGLLAEFASPVEAVRCAIEFQELMRTLNLPLADEQRIRMRIGINLGDVTVKDDDLLGDGVNIAARLEAAAPPDGICVSNGVFEQLVGKLTISSQDLGPIDVKNIPRPVHAHLLKLGGAAAMTPAPGLPAPPAPPRRLVPLILAAGAVILAALALGLYGLLSRLPPSAERQARHPGDGGATQRAFTSFEVAMDRPGGDYASHRLDKADASVCQRLCAEDQRCLAWTYVAPGYQEPSAVCWLKNVVPSATRRDVCCTSGTTYYRRTSSAGDCPAGRAYAYPSGRFVKDGKTWVEYHQEKSYARFEEFNVDQEYVFLVDKSRRRTDRPGEVKDFYVRIPRCGGQAAWTYSNPLSWTPLHNVRREE